MRQFRRLHYQQALQELVCEVMNHEAEVAEFQPGELMQIARHLGQMDFLDRDEPPDPSPDLRAERKIFGQLIQDWCGLPLPNGFLISRSHHIGRSWRKIIIRKITLP
jgi:hypothetical protein